MSAYIEHEHTVQDVEQARDYTRHAFRGGDSARPLAHAPCSYIRR